MMGQSAVPSWTGFLGGTWQRDIDVADFIRRNYTPYDGDGSFLAGPTDRTTAVWDAVSALFPAERERGIYDGGSPSPPPSLRRDSAGRARSRWTTWPGSSTGTWIPAAST